MTTGANSGRRVVIIGGGIAGLAAALCFARTGAEVQVFEQADELREVGAGLQITPNGGAVLAALGLGAIADQRSISASALLPMDAMTGEVIGRFDLSRLPGQPYRFFHRADLLDLLAEGCERAKVKITLDAKAVEVGETHVRFSNGDTAEGDLIVGADGLHSVVRPILNGEDKPFFTGQVAWRSVVKLPSSQPEVKIWMGAGKHVVTYPLVGGRMNIVAVQERKEWAAEGWNFFDEPDVLREVFSDCHQSLFDLFDQMQTVRRWGLFRHPVAKVWHDHSRAILGDAAHPTLPFMAQGANLALEDAFVMARCLDDDPSVHFGLKAYQAERRSRVNRAIEAANRNAVNYHLTGIKRRVAHAGLRTMAQLTPNLFLGRYDWLYNYDVTA